MKSLSSLPDVVAPLSNFLNLSIFYPEDPPDNAYFCFIWRRPSVLIKPVFWPGVNLDGVILMTPRVEDGVIY